LTRVKDNQPTLHADIESYFETAPTKEVERVEPVGKDPAASRSATIASPSSLSDWGLISICQTSAAD
jgi:hypothetical protein